MINEGWIKSGGGPLICVDETWADCWRGVSGSSAPVGDITPASTDYERACAVKQYVHNLSLDGGNALILGDMPLETSILSQGRTIIVRLFYADPTTDFAQLLLMLGDDVFRNPIESTRYDVVTGRVVIFDTALDGYERDRQSLSFGMEVGAYKILTATAEPNSRTSLLLHGFFRVS